MNIYCRTNDLPCMFTICLYPFTCITIITRMINKHVYESSAVNDIFAAWNKKVKHSEGVEQFWLI